MRLTWIAASGVALTSACRAAPEPADPSPGEFKSVIALAARLPANADLAGVAATPEGQRYVLDRNSGLYEIGQTWAKLVLANADLEQVYQLPAGTQFTDVVSLGSGQFALTVENDGYMFDLEAGLLTRYFCYFPDTPHDPVQPPTQPPTVIGGPSVSQVMRAQGIAVKEHTESVAFNPETLQLFAQPQTIRLDNNTVVGSEVFVFRESGGQPVQVVAMPSTSFMAGGMIAGNDRLLLGSGSQLYHMELSTGLALLAEFDAAIAIAGLARDADGDLLILDRTGRRLLETANY